MAFPVFQLDVDRVRRERRLFPDEIDLDDWVMFHGTSGFNSDRMERDGFDTTGVAMSHAQIKSVTDVYEAMNWYGDDLGGYAVLKPFSLDHDFRGLEQSRLFFAETSIWALMYATRNFAGGEKLQTTRRAIEDLEHYLCEPRLRDEHRQLRMAESRELDSLTAHSASVGTQQTTDIDLDWLRQELANLSEIRQMADRAVQEHDHGVVYALRTTADDVARLHWNRFMGIEATARFSSSAIVAKVVVPQDFVMEQPPRQGDDALRRWGSGLIRFLTTEGRSS